MKLQMNRKDDGKVGSMRQKTYHNTQENRKGKGI